MMFRERKGITFFPEASLAAFQIGAPMTASLLALLKGEERTFQAWAKEHQIADAALYAKSAQVLGDLADPRAVQPLVAKLAYKDSQEIMEYAVRVAAAESLGRLRAKEAVKPLAELVMKEREPGARDRYCEALIRIGDREALPALTKAAATDPWELRESPLRAIAGIGDERELKIIEEAQKAEPGKTDNECKQLGSDAQDCKQAKDKRVAMLAEMHARLEAAKACKSELACWTDKLKAKEAAVRERAALEVGRLGKAAQAGALLQTIRVPADTDGDLGARANATLALDWIAASGGLGAESPAMADKLDALVEQEKGKSFTIKVNEDVKRVALKLRRAAGPKG
jgi:HEAT repeat protein